MTRALSILLLFALLNFSLCCYPAGQGGLDVTKGKDTYVCLTVSPLKWGAPSTTVNGTYLRVASKVKADELSKVKIGQCK